MSKDWTRVADQLPAFGVPVLAYCADDEPDIVMAVYREGPGGPYWDYVDKALSDITGGMYPEPSHWRPKPKPPTNL